MEMYKFTITTVSLSKYQLDDWKEERNTKNVEYSFDLYNYREAIKVFDDTCDYERRILQATKRTSKSYVKDGRVVVTLSLDEYDNSDNLVNQIEELDVFDYSYDDI